MPEVDEDAEVCCIEDVLVLEVDVEVDSSEEDVLARELAVLGPVGKLVLPPNWVSAVIRRRKITPARTTGGPR